MSSRGWFWPSNSRKAHYFVDGNAACGKWFIWSDDVRESPPGPDDCKKCAAYWHDAHPKEASDGKAANPNNHK